MKTSEGLEGKRVLIVDDELDILATLEDILEACVLHKAIDFETARELLENHRYDAAILDIMGVRGYELLDLTRAKGIPALMLTAHALTADDFGRSLEKGAMAYIPKEKISEIDIYLNDILDAHDQGLGKLGKWYKRLESFFEEHFGKGWLQKKKVAYQKYLYWLEPHAFFSLKAFLDRKGSCMTEAKKAVCVPLSKSIKVGFVAPDAWEKYELCKRQLSWYRSSSHAGQVLVVSSYELEGDELRPDAVITLGKFDARSLPDREEKIRMIKSQRYQEVKPPEWENIGAEDSALHDKWLKIMGIRGISYEEIFITHCANHSNFIEPVYFINNGKGIIPYSIAKTTHICSACLEFFDIIGSQFQKKLVVPCPGAVLFAGMAPNRYYEVIQPG
jgi:DNA-binding response OmpR family regulator